LTAANRPLATVISMFNIESGALYMNMINKYLVTYSRACL
jgi:hypothetical protein